MNLNINKKNNKWGFHLLFFLSNIVIGLTSQQKTLFFTGIKKEFYL